MDNLSEIIKILSQPSQKESSPPPIPKEVLDQYPYGDFPIRYTKSGQESIRKQSESRYSYSDGSIENVGTNVTSPPPDISSLLALSSILSGKKKQPNEIFELLSSMIFKDKPELKNLFKLISPKPKNQEILSKDSFPNTNTVSISSLKKVNN